MTVAILAYPPVVLWSASITMGCPLADTCTEPATMPSDTMSDPSTVSICGPCNLQAMRSQSAVKAYTPCTNAACPTAVKASVWGRAPHGTAAASPAQKAPRPCGGARRAQRAVCPFGADLLPALFHHGGCCPMGSTSPAFSARPSSPPIRHFKSVERLPSTGGVIHAAKHGQVAAQPGCGPRRLPAPAPGAGQKRRIGGHRAAIQRGGHIGPRQGKNSVPVKLILAALQGHFQHGGTGCLGVARQQVGGPHSVTIRRSTGAEPPRGIAGADLASCTVVSGPGLITCKFTVPPPVLSGWLQTFPG